MPNNLPLAPEDQESNAVVESVKEVYAGYSANTDDHIPIAEYALLMSVFTGAFVGFVLASGKRGKNLPERISGEDLALFGVATHRLSRLLTRGSPTRVLRAPFTEYEGESDAPSEIDEAPRGEGIQRAIGELLTCPWCVAPWISSAFVYGRCLFPKPTRLFAGIFAINACSDYLQLFYRWVNNKVE